MNYVQIGQPPSVININKPVAFCDGVNIKIN
jgi:hypothetical protein